ncbi:oligopeptide/dipeptide ABC transporter ATP-binding protein [Ruminobacter sp. RM87]|jgi:cationic peptide transport system ATP-binding protein|uniref:oligopeptide/dipeptide ABC transporter ATP-binding protein n=1 Tax=Ruminobacter sp. RM87 TaxID=1200567 RepID=UPI000A003CEE|nr:oligopeptide/dipeptide ABC transporter ATP-binding protein [Ruminobacter sp. RM87]
MLLDIRNLTILLRNETSYVQVCKNFDLMINDGEICSLVGSSGSGKSLIIKAIMGMYGHDMKVTVDYFKFRDMDLTNLSVSERRKILSREVGIIFQEARASLDPELPIGVQMRASLNNSCFDDKWYRWPFWRFRAVNNILHKVGIKNTKPVLRSLPYQLSEVLCQKIIIAMALSRKPKLLIADSPISGMTSTSQVQILKLFHSYIENNNGTLLYITNDLGPASNLMDNIKMLYCGQIVESGPKEQVINSPHHPFTQSMINAIPEFNRQVKVKMKLDVLRGDPPEFTQTPIGCPLGPRCPHADRECNTMPPVVKTKNGFFRCYYPLNMEKENESK